MAVTFLTVANNSETTLAEGCSAGATEIAPVARTSFPAAYPFDVTIDKEIVHVTGLNGVKWTVTRAAQGTTAVEHVSGAQVQLNVTAKSVSDLNEAVNALEGPLGGALTGTLPNPSIANGVITNAMVKAAAAIEESKLSLPEVVTKTGTQTITGEKVFKIIKAEQVGLEGAKQLTGVSNMTLTGPGTFSLGEKETVAFGSQVTLKQAKISGKVDNSEAFEAETFNGVIPEAGGELTGMKPGGEKHRFACFVNIGTETLTLVHESAASTAANRFFFASEKTVKLKPGQLLWLWYTEGAKEVPLKERWRDVAGASWNYAATQHAAIAEPAAFVNGAFGYDSEAHAKEIRDKLNEIITVLKEWGLTA